MSGSLTDVHHDWVAQTFGTDPRAGAAAAHAPDGAPGGAQGGPAGGAPDDIEAKLVKAMDAKDWTAAVQALMTLDLITLRARVARLTPEQRVAIHTAAIQDPHPDKTAVVALETEAQGKPADPNRKPDRPAGDGGGQPTSDYGAALKKLGEAALQEFLNTKEGKELKEKVEKTIDSIPAAAKYGVGGAAVIGALAGLAVAHQASPITKTPDIPVGKIGEIGVKIALTWEGPVDKPTKIGATFTFDLPGQDPHKAKDAKPDTAAGAAGPEAPARPARQEGKPALLANFDTGKLGVDKILAELAKHTTSHGTGKIIVVGYYVPQDAPSDPDQPIKDRTDDAAQDQADTMKRALAQMVDADRYTVESAIEPKVSGGRSFGLGADASALALHDLAVIFIPTAPP